MEEQQLRAPCPAASCVSVDSRHSMGNPISFDKQPPSAALGNVSKEVLVNMNQEEDFSENKRSVILCQSQQGALSSVGGCESLKSDRSMELPYEFKHDTLPFGSRSQQGAMSSVGGCESLKSDRSMDHPYEFRHESRSQQGALSSVGGCESLKSDRSMELPYEFKHDTLPFGSSVPQRSEFKDRMTHTQIMSELREKIHMFVESELKHYDRILSPESGEDSEETRDEEEDEHMRSSREAVLNITTHFLMVMKQDCMAHCLRSLTNTEKCLSKLKSNLKRRFQHVFEGITKAGVQTDLSQIYTDLWVTEGDTGEVNYEHEVRQLQAPARKHLDRTIKCQEIFESSISGGQSVRTMLTKGVAGIGKTLCIQKVVLDWAEHKAHRNIRFMIPFCFRELNVLREKHFSLVGFVHHFFHEIKEAGICSFDDVRFVFIFDGLDESRLDLNFQKTPSLTDPTESVSLDVLLVNLIRGKLLHSARLWITTRPAAANQIPAECVSMVTEVQGFADPQKEQYFRKRFRDEQQATAVISHIRTSRSLHIMCHIPIFCWILSTVLLHVMQTGATDQLPQTLTQMYIHFLVVQAKVKSLKYDGRSGTDPPWTPETRKMVESLAKLAFEQLQKGNLIFYESDLSECGLDAAAASVYSGVFTQVFREEPGLYQDKVYCFIHLSVQEFLAALHVHLTFFHSGVNLLSEAPTSKHRPKPVNDRGAEKAFYHSAVDKALQSSNGHLDLFLRFLLGLSLQRNQSLLQGLMKHIQPGSHSSGEAATYIKYKLNKGLPSYMAINLIQCLNELSDSSLMKEVQQFLSSGSFSADRLTPAQWSALVFILLSENSEVFELRKFCCSEEALLRLLPVIKTSTESSLSGCSLSKPSCKALATVIISESCLLQKLDLSYTELLDSGLSTLAEGPRSPLCKLQVLRLRGCRLSEGGCRTLCAVLCSPRCALTLLDVSDNSLQDSGVKLLSEGLQSPHCILTTLRLDGCELSSRSCEDLSTVLGGHTSRLKELDLSNNQLQDSGIELLCCGLKSPRCPLETLRLSGCLLTEKGFTLLGSALSSCHLTELDLRYNHPGESGENILCAARERPDCSLTTARTDHAGAGRLKPGLNKYACELTLDLNTAHRYLLFFENNSFIEHVEETPCQEGPDSFDFFQQVMCSEGLTERCYWEVEWSGLVSVGVTYRGIQRKGMSDLSMLGGNSISWALDCSSEYYFAWHNNIIEKVIPRRAGGGRSPDVGRSRVAVYLDWEAGVVSFYTVLPDRQQLIHTFHSSFSEPLHPAFRLRSEFAKDTCNFVALCPEQRRNKTFSFSSAFSMVATANLLPSTE